MYAFYLRVRHGQNWMLLPAILGDMVEQVAGDKATVTTIVGRC